VQYRYVSIISTCVIQTIVEEYNLATCAGCWVGMGLGGRVTYLHGGGQLMQMRFISIATCCVHQYCSYCAIAGRLILQTAINTHTFVGTTAVYCI